MSDVETIDTRGLLCPIPVIRLQEFCKKQDQSVEVEVVGTDPGVLEDIPLWCRVNGHKHLSSSTQDDVYRVRVNLQPRA